MKTTHATHATSDARYENQTRARPIAMLNITRTITDHIELARDPDSMGLTIGQQIDNHLRNAAMHGDTIQTVALEFERDEWYDFARQLRDDPRPLGA